MRIAILSDTHGLLRPRVLELVAGCDRILHCGDVGDPAVLEALGHHAPVTAVRGNVDTTAPLSRLPATAEGELAGIPFRMTHRREDVDPAWSRQAKLVLFGHSHRPELEWHGACLWLNPGACGHRRFTLPLTLAHLTVDDRGRLTPELVTVE